MYRNISNMLVLFAVVLILPAISGEGSTITSWDCNHAVRKGAIIYCQLSGYPRLSTFFSSTGEVQCVGAAKRLKLPESAWPIGSGEHYCNEEIKTRLQGFTDEMEKKKAKLVSLWCRAA
uniref:Putative ixodes 10 kDa peptide protein n=1 Tax=Ixodes ricinus TaxID=34613 RepID=A0A0K8RBU0_IXORI